MQTGSRSERSDALVFPFAAHCQRPTVHSPFTGYGIVATACSTTNVAGRLGCERRAAHWPLRGAAVAGPTSVPAHACSSLSDQSHRSGKLAAPRSGALGREPLELE